MKINQSASPKSLNAHQRVEGSKINKSPCNNSELLKPYLANAFDIPSTNQKLYQLAKKLSDDCYSLKYPSKMLMRDFIIGIENIKGALA